MGNTESSMGVMWNVCYEMNAAPNDQIVDEINSRTDQREHADHLIPAESFNNSRVVPGQIAFTSPMRCSGDRAEILRCPADDSGSSRATSSRHWSTASNGIREMNVFAGNLRNGSSYPVMFTSDEHASLQVNGRSSKSAVIRASAAPRSLPHSMPVLPILHIPAEPSCRFPLSPARSKAQIPSTGSVVRGDRTLRTGYVSEPFFTNVPRISTAFTTGALNSHTFSSPWAGVKQPGSRSEQQGAEGHMQHLGSPTAFLLSRHHAMTVTPSISPPSHYENSSAARPYRTSSVHGSELYDDIPEAHQHWMPSFETKSQGRSQATNGARYVRGSQREGDLSRTAARDQSAPLKELIPLSSVPDEGVRHQARRLSDSRPLMRRAGLRTDSTVAPRMATRTGRQQKQSVATQLKPETWRVPNSSPAYGEGRSHSGGAVDEGAAQDGVMFVYYGAIVGTMLNCMP